MLQFIVIIIVVKKYKVNLKLRKIVKVRKRMEENRI